MKSTTGNHYIALDHVRAVAAFLVFVWHFTRGIDGTPVPYDYRPAFFGFSLLNEGYIGVSVFMTLSGYLFARLINGREIVFRAFLWNRVLRLIPLLVVMLIVAGALTSSLGGSLKTYGLNILKGVLYPTLPNGGWSITVEFHFYILLPLLLWMQRKSKWLPLVIVAVAILVRWAIFHRTGEVRYYGYSTMIGRIDQFVWGMVICQYRDLITRRHVPVILFLLGYLWFNWAYGDSGASYIGRYSNHAETNPIWIILPTIEGLAFAVVIAWYDTSFEHSTTGFSRFVSLIGEYSYFIYLFHFFIVFNAAHYIHTQIMDISNFYLAAGWAAVVMICMMPAAYLSSVFIEMPWMAHRKKYIQVDAPAT